MIAWRRSGPRPIGVSIGDRRAHLAQLAGSPGRWSIQALAEVELPPEDDGDREIRDREAAAILAAVLSDHSFKGRRAVGALCPRDLCIQSIRLPDMPEEEIDNALAWEARERLPFPVEEAEIRHLKAGRIRHESDKSQEVILLACRRQLIERRLRLLESAGLRPEGLDIDPCAVLRCLETRRESAAGPSAYLHLGEQSSTVIFAEDGRVLFLKELSGGGCELDAAVGRRLGLNPAQAGRLRAGLGNAGGMELDDELRRSVADALRDPLEAMATELALCLRYYTVTFRGRPLEQVVVTGPVADPWMIGHLSDRLRTTCVSGNPLERLGLDVPGAAGERPTRWTTALGLALKPPAATGHVSAPQPVESAL
ncbi:MAG: pilus assembly protein PilM [Planctomycetes bacterium]|nr:pilus assembly protein PilM [Planctomycetota bacterium]